MSPFVKEIELLRQGHIQIELKKGDSPHYHIIKKIPKGYVALSEIPFHVSHAILVSEDWSFYLHAGMDFHQLRKALRENLRGKRHMRGASTITQQLIKNLFLTHEKTLWRKLKEAILSLYLELRLPKKKILELYLNAIQYGDNIYGIQQAAYYYFNRPVSELSAKEGAFLAMLLPNPVRYAESFKQKMLTPYAEKTMAQILFKMKIAGFISSKDYFRETNKVLWQTQDVLSE